MSNGYRSMPFCQKIQLLYHNYETYRLWTEIIWAEMVMGRTGHWPKWLWAEMTSDRLDILDLRRTTTTKKRD